MCSSSLILQLAQVLVQYTYLINILSIMHVVKSGSTCVMFLSIIKLTWKLPNNTTVRTNRSVSEKNIDGYVSACT
jgi:hypothetical protein